MSTTRASPERRRRSAQPEPFNRAYALAFFGALAVGYALWTWGARLLDSPHSITKYPGPDSPSLWVAPGYESVMIIAAVAILVAVVRGCLLQRAFTRDTRQ